MSALVPNLIRRRLLANERQFGVFVSSASTVVAEGLGIVGVDFAVLDMEHAPQDVPQIFAMLQAATAGGLPTAVRIPWNDAVAFKRVLDAGAQTIMCPVVQSAEEAEAAVAAMRYPPRGIRGAAAGARGSRYGTIPDYFRTADQELALLAQIETPEAVERIDAILAVDGVTSVFVGPNDLSTAMGHAGNAAAPDVQAAIVRVAEAAKRAGKPCGIFAPGGNAAPYLAMGYTFISFGTDTGLLFATARARMAEMRGL